MTQKMKQFIFNPWLISLVVIVAAGMVMNHFYVIKLVKRKSAFKAAPALSEDSPDRSKDLTKVKKKPELKVEPEDLNLDFQNLSQKEKNQALAYLKFKRIKDSFVPSGVPEIYGKELEVNFNRVQESMNKMRVFGPSYGEKGKKITLSGRDKERYINITSQTSCEYCCGAKSLVRKNGDAACGCAHSIVMRGLAAYLIKNHAQLSDERILEELNTWRRTFFPKQTLTLELQRMKKAGVAGIGEILETFPSLMPRMVGGC